MTRPSQETITGLLLAGGQGRRLGGVDKGWVPYQGRALVGWALQRLRPQVDAVIISANRHPARYAELGWPVVADAAAHHDCGPLGGIAAGLVAATTPLVLVVPCDMPALPMDLAARLLAALRRGGVAVAIAHDGQRLQPVCALLRRDLVTQLNADLARGLRRSEDWLRAQTPAIVDFSDQPEAFLNINTPVELEGAPTKSTATGDA